MYKMKVGQYFLPHSDLWEKPVGRASVGTIFSHPPDRLDLFSIFLSGLECGSANPACLLYNVDEMTIKLVDCQRKLNIFF